MARDLNDIKLTKEELENAARYVKEMAALKGVKESQLTLSKETIRTMAKEIATGQYKADKELIKDVKSTLKDYIREQKSQSDPNSFKGLIEQLKSGKSGSEGLDWRLDRRVNAFNSLLSGNFKYGATQFLQTFERGKILLNHPMFMFTVAAAKLGLALADFSTKTDRLANRIAGGSLVSPEAKNRKWQMSFQDTLATMAYGQDKNDFYNYKISTFGALTKRRMSEDPRFTEAWSQGRAALQDLGASPDSMNTLLQQQVAIGRTSVSMEKFNYKLIKALQGLDKLGSAQFVQSLAELNKTLLANNINGLANAESLRRFQDQLNKGTLSVADFTRGLTSRRSGETSTLAGVGAMLAERGLGGKELQDAYRRGDMIAVAGAVRRGGMSIQRDIEKIAPEISRQLGTSDWREALALQSGTAWGQLTGDLKNLEVQRILASGGSLGIGIQGKDISLKGLTTNLKGQEVTEQEDFKQIDKELISATVDNTNALKVVANLITLGGLWGMSASEKAGLGGKIQNAFLNSLPAIGPTKMLVEFTVKNPNQ